MFNKSLLLVTSLFAFVCLTGLSGCSTTSVPSSKYTSKYNGYTQVSNLPADYPTRSLPNGNIWDDFRRQMQLPLNLNKAQVQYQIRWYQSHQDFLNRSLTRGAQYFYYILQETKRRNLPAELALIPIFESGYVPIGRSNKGAVGLWQFMPRSAANFKIRMNKWYDGRRDVISSTDAALRYLTYLYYYFDKDWFLAISAYNCGEGNIQAAVLRNKRRGYSADFWSLRLPQETKAYIPQLLAISAIIRNPGKYGVSLVPINNGPYFDRIDVGKSITLDKAAKMSGASEWSMRMLNAGLLHGVTEPDGPYVIEMPHSRMVAFKDSLSGRAKVLPANSTETIASTAPAPQQDAQAKLATAASTVTLATASSSTAASTTASSTADNATNVSALASAAADEHKTVVSGAENAVNLSRNADEDDTDISTAQQNKTTHKKLNKKQSLAQVPARSASRQYAVGRGETLFSIARQYNTSVTTLRHINKLKDNNIKPGKILLIPEQSSLSASSDMFEHGAGGNVTSGGSANRPTSVATSASQKSTKVSGKVKGRAVTATTMTKKNKAVNVSNSAPKKQNKNVAKNIASNKKKTKHTS